MFAVIETGGKQYRVSPGQKIKIETIEVAPSAPIVFDKVLLVVDGETVRIGTPYIEGAAVESTALRHGRARKVIVFKYHSKTRYRKKKGHRQEYSEVAIRAIKAAH